MRPISLAAILALAAAGPAAAWPIRACPARLPAAGQVFAGRVNHVGDGDSLCVAGVSVRLADFYAPELDSPGGPAARAALVDLAAGRQVDCRADHVSYDRIVATCRLNGASLGDLMRRAGVREGGNGWPPHGRASGRPG